MAFIIADRVQDVTATTGTGAVTLAATPPAGYRTFSTVCSVSDTLPYVIEDTATGDWETGIGTYSSSNTLTRTTVVASSNANAAVNFAAGSKRVFLDVAAYTFTTKMHVGNGFVVDFANGDVTVTHATNSLAFAGASNGYSFDAAAYPSANDGAALGKAGTAWSDAYLASGGIIDWANGGATFQHIASGNNLKWVGGNIYNNVSNPLATGVAGWSFLSSGSVIFSADSGGVATFSRNVNDGVIVTLSQDGNVEGQISVSGTTIAYGTFCGAHLSQLFDLGILDIPRGTIVETIDDMCAWPGEENDQLAKFKISDMPGSAAVYGVFMDWDAADMDSNDALIASLGAYLIRIDAGETVQRGELIESAGNGCGRVQADDIVRSSTVGKVTSSTVVETYPDGSYLVPCVLYCG